MKAAPYVFLKSGTIIIHDVDDLIVFSEDASAINKLIEHLRRKCRIKDLGTLSQFLGIEVDWSEKCSIKMRQSRLMKPLLKTTVIINAKPVANPINHSLPEEQMMTSELLNVKDCRKFLSIVKSLI